MEVDKCAVCGAAADKRCAGCHEVYYCTKDHQKQHWKRHKTICKPVKVCKDSVLGHYLVASRDIKVGEVVVRESPLIRGPTVNSPAVCLACLQRISPSNTSLCKKCGLPLCHNPTCHNSKEHLPECEWTKYLKISPEMIGDLSHMVNMFITPLRLCYARRHQPEVWARLSMMETHTAERRKTERFQTIDKTIAKTFFSLYDLQDFTEDDIFDMIGIVDVNAHEVLGPGSEYMALYDKACLIEHSCFPNCNKTISPEGEMIIHAGQDIPKGHHISISYTDRRLGTALRFKHLLGTKYFRCKCVRCIDNTEMGTYYSAILCQNSKCGGSVLPENLCDLAPGTLWTCDRCGTTVTNETVTSLLNEVREELNRLERLNSDASFKFLKKWKSKLHPNHFHLTSAQIALVGQLCKESQGVGGLTDDHLQSMIDMCRHLGDLLATLIPAELHVRGLYRGNLYECLAERARRLISQGKKKEGNALMEESMKFMEEANKLIESQPEYKFGGKVFRTSEIKH